MFRQIRIRTGLDGSCTYNTPLLAANNTPQSILVQCVATTGLCSMEFYTAPHNMLPVWSLHPFEIPTPHFALRYRPT